MIGMVPSKAVVYPMEFTITLFVVMVKKVSLAVEVLHYFDELQTKKLHSSVI
jgi:hypothetical protein